MVRAQTNKSILPHRWEKISALECSSKITAIFVDAHSSLNQGGYYNFGVIEEPLKLYEDRAEAPVPTMEPIERAPLGDGSRYPLFHLTTGSLHNVDGLQIQKVSHRCRGLRIIHSNGLDDYLGAWDPQDASSISTIYSSDEGLLMALRFQFQLGDDEDGFYVSGISTCIKTPSSPREPLQEDLALDQRQQLPSVAESPNHDLYFSCGEPRKVRVFHQYVWLCSLTYYS